MVRRVCRELGTKKNIIVINDEAHHCYRRKPDGEDEKLTGDDRKEAEKRDEEARVWISGLEAVKAKIGVKAIYDLSATPFFLRGSGYPEGTLFPWVVSDFSLIDAIEAGIVKVPRVPVADDSMTGDQPTYRDLWLRIREDLPKKGRKTEELGGEPKLPAELQGALHSLYSNYEKYYRLWEQNAEAQRQGHHAARLHRRLQQHQRLQAGLRLHRRLGEADRRDRPSCSAGPTADSSATTTDGGWLHRPNTILVDSEQLESGEAMSADFKKIAAREIEEFKAEYRARFPGRDAENLTDEDLLREVMNTVGKAGKLGEHVKCVVSVSMLTEGWDANTVTHVLGVRAFGTQLLCEQVVGRGLAAHELRRQRAGPCSSPNTPRSTACRSRSSRAAARPRTPSPARCRPASAPWKAGSPARSPSPACSATATNGRRAAHGHVHRGLPTDPLDGRHPDQDRERPDRRRIQHPHASTTSKRRRPNEVAFLLAKLTLEKYFRRRRDGNDKPWLFPQLLGIAKRWLAECVTLQGQHVPATAAADRVRPRRRRPHLQGDRRLDRRHGGAQADPAPLRHASARRATSISTRPGRSTPPAPTSATSPTSWPTPIPGSRRWPRRWKTWTKSSATSRTTTSGFTIPYTLNGEEHQYIPDFIACIDDGHGPTTC